MNLDEFIAQLEEDKEKFVAAHSKAIVVRGSSAVERSILIDFPRGELGIDPDAAHLRSIVLSSDVAIRLASAIGAVVHGDSERRVELGQHRTLYEWIERFQVESEWKKEDEDE